MTTLPTDTFNSLPVYGGTLDAALLNTPFTCSIVNGKDDKHPTVFNGTIGEFVERHCSTFEATATKDTSGFMFSTYKTGRKGNDATALTGRMYDFDDDWTYDVDALTRDAMKTGLFTLIYHSGRAFRAVIADHDEKDGQKSFESYLAERGEEMSSGDMLDEQSRAYMRDVLKFPDGVLPDCAYGGETDDGAGQFFTHPPMKHKLRALTFYAAPYEITDDNRKDVLAKHARTYDSTAAARYTAKNDAACKNLSRLMYQPSQITSWHKVEGTPEIRIVAGKLDAFEDGVEPTNQAKPAKSAATRPQHDNTTRVQQQSHPRNNDGVAPEAFEDDSDDWQPWLIDGMGDLATVIVGGAGYMLWADYAVKYAEDAVMNAQGGVEAVCDNGSPNPHTEPDNGARKLFAYNGGPDNARGGHGRLGCCHNGCGAESSYRKLDRLAYKHGHTLEFIVGNFTSDALGSERTVRNALKVRGRLKPVVRLVGSVDRQVDDTSRHLREAFKDSPRLFEHAALNKAVRLQFIEAKDDIRLEYVNTADTWRDVVESEIAFKAPILDHGRIVDWKSVHAPDKLIARVRCDAHMWRPLITQISRVARFDRNFNLKTTAGYDAARQVYYAGNARQLSLPDAAALPTATRRFYRTLAKSIVLNYALRDFAFVDKTDGSDAALPVHQYDTDGNVIKDGNGHRRPNFERGKGSRANAVAYLLEPLLREAELGGFPINAIHKYENAEGAGALLNLRAYVCGLRTGGAETHPWPTSEHFRQQDLLAAVAEGRAERTYDNASENETVDSAVLAQVTTSGEYSGRRLATNETIGGKVNLSITLAGKALSLSHELRRRSMLISLNSGFKNPSVERNKIADWFMFKGGTYDATMKKQAPKILWALQFMVADWAADGAVIPSNAAGVPSFDKATNTIAAILAHAGIEGYLTNWASWAQDSTGNDESADTKDFVLRDLFEEFGENVFNATDAYDHVLKDTFVEAAGTLSSYGRDTRPTYGFKYELGYKTPPGGPTYNGVVQYAGRYLRRLEGVGKHVDAQANTYQLTRDKAGYYSFVLTHRARA